MGNLLFVDVEKRLHFEIEQLKFENKKLKKESKKKDATIEKLELAQIQKPVDLSRTMRMQNVYINQPEIPCIQATPLTSSPIQSTSNPNQSTPILNQHTNIITLNDEVTPPSQTTRYVTQTAFSSQQGIMREFKNEKQDIYSYEDNAPSSQDYGQKEEKTFTRIYQHQARQQDLLNTPAMDHFNSTDSSGKVLSSFSNRSTMDLKKNMEREEERIMRQYLTTEELEKENRHVLQKQNQKMGQVRDEVAQLVNFVAVKHASQDNLHLKSSTYSSAKSGDNSQKKSRSMICKDKVLQTKTKNAAQIKSVPYRVKKK